MEMKWWFYYSTYIARALQKWLWLPVWSSKSSAYLQQHFRRIWQTLVLYNNISSVTPQVGSEEGSVYAALSLSCEGFEAVLKGPSAQVKQEYEKEIQ